jgi:chromate transporter
VIGIIGRAAFKLTKLTLAKRKLLWGIFVALAVSMAWASREITWLFLVGGAVNLLVKLKAFPSRLQASNALSSLFTAGSVWHVRSKRRPVADLWLLCQRRRFVFGSGLAVVPFLYGRVVHGHHWLTDHQFEDAVAGR